MELTHSREELLVVFKTLRKHKLMARANYMCCGSCAGAGIHDDKQKSKREYIGYVFWHNQDEEKLYWKKEPGVYLGFGSFEADENGSENTKKIGDLIAEEFRKAGFELRWDGTGSSRIFVHLAEVLQSVEMN